MNEAKITELSNAEQTLYFVRIFVYFRRALSNLLMSPEKWCKWNEKCDDNKRLFQKGA